MTKEVEVLYDGNCDFKHTFRNEKYLLAASDGEENCG